MLIATCAVARTPQITKRTQSTSVRRYAMTSQRSRRFQPDSNQKPSVQKGEEATSAFFIRDGPSTSPNPQALTKNMKIRQNNLGMRHYK
ncbi:MAG: hypothetical protein NT107_01070 [Planctomycetota bacterium]|nr:hypothetical protein [Planctomycetota bacterium]